MVSPPWATQRTGGPDGHRPQGWHEKRFVVAVCTPPGSHVAKAAVSPLIAPSNSAMKPGVDTQVMRRIIRGASFRACGILAVVIGLFVVLNVRWIWLYRHGNLLDIDEAGYFSYAVIDYYGGRFAGVMGWLNAVNIPSIQAPLLTAFTSVIFLLFGIHPILGFAVTTGFAALAVAVAAGIGWTLRSPLTGLIAALLTACCPAIIDYARSFQFSTAATFVTTLAVLAMIRSRRFGHIGWAATFGVSLGLMPLARTMTIAFLPGMLVAGLVCVVGERQGLMRRLTVFCGSILLAVLVSATWLTTSGPLVFHYLFSFGYGRQALEYGHATSKFGLDAWTQSLHALVLDVHLPFFLVICAAALTGIIFLMRQLWRLGLPLTFKAILRSPVFLVFIVAAEQLLALTSSSNKGSGFFVPIVPLVAALAGYVVTAIPSVQRRQGRTLFVASAFAALVWLPSVQLVPGLSAPYVMDVPILEAVPLSDGRSTLQTDEERAGYGAPGALIPVSGAQALAWRRLSDEVSAYVIDHFGKDIEILWGFRHELFNVNTIQLSNLIQRGSAFSQIMIDPTIVAGSRSDYQSWLRQSCIHHCVLLTSDRVTGDFRPFVDTGLMAEAARSAGFSLIRSWVAPDQQVISLWVSTP